VDTASEGFSDMASGGSGDMASGGSGGHKSHGRKATGLEWDGYDDNTQKARAGWENTMQYVGFPHFDQLWPRPCYERHYKGINTSYMKLEDMEAK
jgi:hypothetical protein